LKAIERYYEMGEEITLLDQAVPLLTKLPKLIVPDEQLTFRGFFVKPSYIQGSYAKFSFQ
jgi:hypothetical protein